MREPTAERADVERMTLAVRGVVQGVGFRPFVYNAARAAGLAGWVRNETDLVRIEVEGDSASLDAFLDTLRHKTPPQARIDSIDVRRGEVNGQADGLPEAFEILPSRALAARRPAIPADLATCAECLAEIRDPRQRRYGYPFTNCTNCGPRWSIIEGLPYDRPRTSMRRFAMCEACRGEYVDPGDRRFHAQPIACGECGPALRLLDTGGGPIARCDEALAKTAEAILTGQIVAVKGLGGFQLLVDATDDEAVARLRERKRRPAKPFAVMVHTLDDARSHCEISNDEAALLSGPAAPIVLVRRRGEGHVHASVDMAPDAGVDMAPDLENGDLSSNDHALRASGRATQVAESVAPGNPYLGVMLPYTPLHHLLMDRLRRPIVCTSGNLAEEPMATRTDEALERLGQIADVVLSHDRPITRPVDDSVVRCDPSGPVVLRRARGYAPLPIDLGGTAGSEPTDGPVVLAVGGHLKNAVALRLGDQVVMGSHVGDLDSPLSWDVHRRAVDDLVSFFDVRPDVVACDMHPDYMSTQHAERLAAEWGVPLVQVQHHHAHVAACMAEHGLTGPVLGLAWDGSGYGPDGTVWGGEALWCEGAMFRRMGHLRRFRLPGGDQAVRRPRRTALGALMEISPKAAEQWAERWFSPAQRKMLLSMLRRDVRCPATSSMGRLFDVVAALCGLPDRALPGKPAVAPGEHWRNASGTQQEACTGVPGPKRSGGPDDEPGESVISFEGEAAMALEFAADWDEPGSYPIALSSGEPVAVDWAEMIRAVLVDVGAAVPVATISGRFHNTLAEAALGLARRSGCSQVVLTGGCFQNRLLAERVRGALSRAGFNVYTHEKVPPGDGGVALGQALVAGRQATRSEQPCV